MVVPVRNGDLHLGQCLDALSRSEHGSFEVIVVDDWSTDNTPQVAQLHNVRTFKRLERWVQAGREISVRNMRTAIFWRL